MPDDHFGTRPGPRLNPINVIYFHLLRHWDWEIDILCRNQSLGIGIGGRGSSAGFDDEEVDAVPVRPDLIGNDHQVLETETQQYLGAATGGKINEEIDREQARIYPHTRESLVRNVLLHSAERLGDILFVKGMLGISEPAYPGSTRKS